MSVFKRYTKNNLVRKEKKNKICAYFVIFCIVFVLIIKLSLLKIYSKTYLDAYCEFLKFNRKHFNCLIKFKY